MDLDAKARKKNDFEALFKRNFTKENHQRQNWKTCWQITAAALMQPLHYYLRDPAPKDNSITHAAAGQTNLTQPLQSVLQHHVANLHVSTHVATPDDNNHVAIPMRSATTASRNAQNSADRNNHSLQSTGEEPKRPQPHSPHTRGTFHRRLQPLYTEKHKILCSGFLQNTAHATFMQPLQCVSQHHVANLHVSTHMATPDDNNHAAIPMRSATKDSRNA